MLIAGARRHAKEILELFHRNNETEGLYFFDDITPEIEDKLYGIYPILRDMPSVNTLFKSDRRFVLGLGTPGLRYILAQKLSDQGGQLVSIIADTCIIGHYDLNLGNGLNVMHQAMISNSVCIGEGTLINAFVSIHHDAVIGMYCEVSPHASLLGGCIIGDFTSIGSNATILPNIKVGKNVQIGAGALVNRDLPDNCVALGVPAKIIRMK